MTANCPSPLPPCAELFAGLQEQTAAALKALGRTRSWRRHDHLYLAGQRADTLHFLLSGRLKEYYGDAAGEEWLRRVIHPGEMVFAFCLCHPEFVHASSCAALTAAITFAVPLLEFDRLAHADGTLSRNVATILARQGERSYRHACLARKPGARARVAGYLLSRLHRDRPCDGEPLAQSPLPVDLRPISLAAEEINLARETFSRTLVELSRTGLISNRRGLVIIHDSAGLMAVAAADEPGR